MKQLRILTGLHAGAQLDLKRRQYRIGSDEAADILISDWKHDPLNLVIDEGNNAMLLALQSPDTAAADAAAAEIALEDHVPRRFAEIVLCVGQAGAWPSDMALMSRLLRRSQEKKERTAKASRRAMVGATLGSLAMLAWFTALVERSAEHAQAKVPVVPLAARVQQALSRSALAGLSVRQAGTQVIVEGLLRDTAELTRLRAALQPFGGGQVMHKVATVTDLSQSISDALANRGLNVSYLGEGVFAVGGASTDLDRLRGSVQRIAADLGPLIKRIDLVASELPPPERVRIGAMLAADDLQYVQTGDGTKHISLSASAARE